MKENLQKETKVKTSGEKLKWLTLLANTLINVAQAPVDVEAEFV